MARVWAYAVSTLVLAAVFYPLSWKEGRDSFPLSSYPMFARNRRSAELNAVYAVALEEDGARHYVPPELVANREVLQARAVLERAAGQGKKGTRALCEEIAGRLRGAGGAIARATTVRLLRGKHDALHYFDTGELGEERVLAECPVEP
ncbi:MAG TPA: hypothetical protein VMZ28_20815 [Kofleriaceae bacterium]|nr:hypothetical protein [Kofleriaceae bacterium]